MPNWNLVQLAYERERLPLTLGSKISQPKVKASHPRNLDIPVTGVNNELYANRESSTTVHVLKHERDILTLTAKRLSLTLGSKISQLTGKVIEEI